MATSRAGGVNLFGAFASGTKTGSARNGLILGLGVVPPPKVSRAGGVNLFGAFRSGTKAPPITTLARAGGVHGLGLFYSGTKAVSVPQVANQTPAPGGILYPGDTVSFDVVDIRALFFIEIQVDQGRREVIHDGDSFVAPYQTSIRVPISGGYRYQVRRSGGWVAPATFRVRAYDVNLSGG